MAVGHGSAASLAPRRATIEARHFGVRGGLVDEDDPCRIEVELPFEPRLTRRVHRAAALLGGGYLLFIDTLARVAAPVEIPLGILTAVIGTPFFIWLLAGMQRTWS